MPTVKPAARPLTTAWMRSGRSIEPATMTGLATASRTAPDEICDIDTGAIGKEIEAVDAFAGGKVFCACNDLRHGTLQNAGMARNAAGEG